MTWMLGAAGARAVTTTYTLDADFDLGMAFNVNHDAVPDQLQVNAVGRPYPFLWVAASYRNTVVKIHTETGAIVGEYRSAPDDLPDPDLGGRNPSRTTVDRLGNLWVSNRNSGLATGLVGEDGRPYVLLDGSVTRIGLLEAGQCVDRDGNGVIDTSGGLGDVRPWTNAGGADTLGGIATADDECILLFKRVDPPSTRHLSIDHDGNVWVGGDALAGIPDKKFQLLDGRTAAVLRTIDLNDPADSGEPGPLFSGPFAAGYGGFNDCNGYVWSAGNFTNTLLRIDPTKPNGDPDLILPIDVGTTSYGLGLAPDGFVWHGTFASSTLIKYAPSGAVAGGPYASAPGELRGVAVSPFDGHAWAVSSTADLLARHAPDGTLLALVPVGDYPTGVAIDSTGKVWVVNREAGTAQRVDPATNAVELTVDMNMVGHPMRDAPSPYNYSDMTGSLALMVAPFGRWTVTTTGPCPETTWTSVAWSGLEPGASRLTVEVRSAEDAGALQAAAFQVVGNGAPLAGPVGRLLETRVNFEVDRQARCGPIATAVLFDLTVTGEDRTAPTITCPADATVECNDEPPDDEPEASDNCGDPTLSMSERREDGPCPSGYRLLRTWTARDGTGNASNCLQAITVRDTGAPMLSGVPADTTDECDAVPPPPPVSASDACGAATLDFVESRVPGRCRNEYLLQRTWTASDDCGNTASASQRLAVVDTTPPALAGVPADMTVECDDVPPPPPVTATDACGAATLDFSEARADGACPAEYVLTRTWTASDDCGNTASASQRLAVIDTTPPALAGVPADMTVECDAVPPPPPVSASDACGATRLDFVERSTPGRCRNERILERTWSATDDCGNAASRTQVVTVRDTTPPVVTETHAPDCVWPPSHRYLCFTDLAELVDALDNCPGEIRLAVASCRSDQPEDQQGPDDRGMNGDGNTLDDCVVADDGSGFCVRAERLGQCADGRTYGVGVAVSDECGNVTTVELQLHVPHDQRLHPDCVPDDPHDMLLPHEPPPFAWTPDPDPDAGLPHPFECPRAENQL
jgi:DNA-binding beta-propeller fold protein YncE